METKAAIRKQTLRKREALSFADSQRYSQNIWETLIRHDWFTTADWILSYVSFGSEVSTIDFIQYALSIGKKIAVPKVTGAHEMKFYEIHSLDELSPGYFGVMEPAGNTKEIIPKSALMIMPGVAFDKQHHRIGYGKGFYDTYLKKHPSYQTIALAFSVQCMDEVPVENGDIAPKIIITEKEITYDRIMERCSF